MARCSDSTGRGNIVNMCRFLVFPLFLLVAFSVSGQEGFDIDAWHEHHPLSREDSGDDGERPLQFGLFPSAGIVLGLPNGLAGTVELDLSLRRPGKFGFFIGGGYEYGAAVTGTHVTVGWGGLRKIPASQPQLGFSGAFLRYRQWNSERHGRHKGLSVGVKNSMGALTLGLEFGLSRSEQNHWIPAARIGIGYAFPLLRDL